MKILKILSLNFIFLVLVFILFDWIFYACHAYKVMENPGWFNSDRIENDLPFDKNKRPVVLMGCSYVFGAGVDYNQTISYKMQERTGRKVYNFGQIASGVQHCLFFLQEHQFFKEHKNLDPDYVIYLFINDHMRRMYVNFFDEDTGLKYLRYEKKNDSLVRKNMHIVPLDYLRVTLLYKKINNFFIKNKSADENFEFLKMHLGEIKNEINQKYKDTEFVVIVYPADFDRCFEKSAQGYSDKWQSLESQGIHVIDLSKENFEFKDEYIASDGLHPSGKAWDKLLPVIIKDLNL